MSYTQSAAISNIDGLMNQFNTILSSSGWTVFNINTSSAIPPTLSRAVKESLYKCNGTSADPALWFLDLYRHYDSSAAQHRIGAMVAGCCRNFDTRVLVSSITRSAAGIIEVTCSTNHNLNNGDFCIVNGVNNPDLNETWGGEPDPTRGAHVSVISQTIFTFPSVSTTIASGSGGNVVSVSLLGSCRVDNSANGVNIPLSDANLSIFCYYDSYRICGTVNQGGTFQTFYFGETGRDHIPTDFNGRAFLTLSAGPGGSTASLDRNASLFVGQQVWLINPTASNNASGSWERVTITTRPNSSSFGYSSSGSITYPTGTLVGEDPLPVMVLGRIGNSSSTQALNARGVRFIFHINATRTDNISQTMTAETESQIGQGNINPDSAQYYQGKYIYMYKTTPEQGSRGRLVGLVSFPQGVQNDQDLMRNGAIAITEDYKVFVSLATDSSYIQGIGPGAS